MQREVFSYDIIVQTKPQQCCGCNREQWRLLCGSGTPSESTFATAPPFGAAQAVDVLWCCFHRQRQL
jgi:hypothetical protein